MSQKCDKRDDTPSSPNSGVTLHPEKAAHDQKQGRAGLSNPSAGGNVRAQKSKDASRPSAGGDSSRHAGKK